MLTHRIIWPAWVALDAEPEGRERFLQALRDSVPIGYTLRSEEPIRVDDEAFLSIRFPPYAVWTAERCLASNTLGEHTCGRETTMFFQGNEHTHKGENCEDWAHCSRTSDEQEASR